jgi:hypothetical protein
MINITLTKDNIHAYKKKYPITFYKLDQMVGDPKKNQSGNGRTTPNK